MWQVSSFAELIPLFIFRFDDFRLFMDNLQTEVLHMEFHEFAKGTSTITELDFARSTKSLVITAVPHI